MTAYFGISVLSFRDTADVVIRRQPDQSGSRASPLDPEDQKDGANYRDIEQDVCRGRSNEDCANWTSYEA